MATPKYKTSKSKAASRKAENMKLKAPTHVVTLFLHTVYAQSVATMQVSL